MCRLKESGKPFKRRSEVGGPVCLNDYHRANMKATIKAVRDTGLECTFIVGGAVLNEDYREFVGANYYAKDALESVKYAQAFF